MQVKESDSHLLFEEVVVQGKRRKLGPPAEDTCGKQVTRQCQKEARSHSPEDCNSSLRMHQETTRGPMDVGCQEAGPTEWPLAGREDSSNALNGSPGNFLGLLIIFSISIWVVATYAKSHSSVPLKICALYCMKIHTLIKYCLKGSTINYQWKK